MRRNVYESYRFGCLGSSTCSDGSGRLAGIVGRGLHATPDVGQLRAESTSGEEVAGQVAVGVVNGFDVVQVQHQQRQRASKAAAAGDLALYQIGKGAAV